MAGGLRAIAPGSSPNRREGDFYETPKDATVALMRFLEERKLVAKSNTIWEPACGTGAISNVLRELGYFTVDSDINPMCRAAKVSFYNADISADWIITNPPFSEAEGFIERADSFGVPFAMLLKSQFWHAKRRLGLFLKVSPSFALPLTWRPDFCAGERGGSPTMEVAWSVWCGRRWCEYVPLERPGV